MDKESLGRFDDDLSEIRAHLDFCNISEVSRQSGVSRQTIYWIIKGHDEKITLRTFYKLAKFFDIEK